MVKIDVNGQPLEVEVPAGPNADQADNAIRHLMSLHEEQGEDRQALATVILYIDRIRKANLVLGMVHQSEVEKRNPSLNREHVWGVMKYAKPNETIN